MLTRKQIAAKVFGLTYTHIDCSEHTTLGDFADGLLVVDNSSQNGLTRQDYFVSSPTFRSMPRSTTVEKDENKKIANVIIAKNLDEAPQNVQIQALELMRTKRIFTRTNVQAAPKPFLFIALLAGGEGPRLTKHLNDYIFISHYHDPEDGFPNIEDTYSDSDSLSSVVKKSPGLEHNEALPRIPASDIDTLAHQSSIATASVEVRRYQHNVISFLRLHRAVGGGISAMGTKYFEKLTRYKVFHPFCKFVANDKGVLHHFMVFHT